MNLFCGTILVFSLTIYDSFVAPQEATTDQPVSTIKQDATPTVPENGNITNSTQTPITDTQNATNYFIQYKIERRAVSQENFITKVYAEVTGPILKFIEQPMVNNVLRNIGTCVVNGAMEIISYYLPAPFIPLIATAAGMVIPFEPVVTLREKMPVASYRRAFQKAVNGFLGTFDKYKLEHADDDPYMTRRFNRRIMDLSKEKDKNKSD